MTLLATVSVFCYCHLTLNECPRQVLVQWNLDFTIWQGDNKIISLNQDIVVNELPIYK